MPDEQERYEQHVAAKELMTGSAWPDAAPLRERLKTGGHIPTPAASHEARMRAMEARLAAAEARIFALEQGQTPHATERVTKGPRHETFH